MKKIIWIFFLLLCSSKLEAFSPNPVKVSAEDIIKFYPEIAEALTWDFYFNPLQNSLRNTEEIKPIVSPVLSSAEKQINREISKPPILNDSKLTLSKIPQAGYFPKSYFNWPAWAKEDLKKNYETYFTWLVQAQSLYQSYEASGFQTKPADFDTVFSITNDPDPSPVNDLPTNLSKGDYPTIYSQITFGDAWNLFVKKTAFQLALEASKSVNWSLNSYSGEYLKSLFDGKYYFERKGNLFELKQAFTLTSPLKLYSFLAQNKLLGKSPQEQVLLLLGWERANMFHAGVPSGFSIDWKDMGAAYFQYYGSVPAVKMLSPTQCIVGGKTCSDTKYFTLGCSSTSALNAYIGMSLNIPAGNKFIEGEDHMTFFYPTLNYYFSHGDDATTPKMYSYGEIPTSEIPISLEQYNKWFIENPEKKANVGRQIVELTLKYLPKRILRVYCDDGEKPHASSQVADWLKPYTVEELETMKIWDKLQQKVESLGGCGQIPFF